eukprot:40380_1
MIEKMEIDDLHKYNVGLGAASSRTKKQKKLAQEYTDKILGKIKTTWITSDASISSKTDKGGIGIIAINNKKEEIFEMKEKVDTNDAQYGEIYGIKRIFDKIIENKIKIKEKVAIICDCKNAIKIITNYISCPKKYKNLIQEINEKIYILNNIKNIQHNLIWIPGHTDNKYNDKVDKLAKEAAREWPLSSQQQQQLSSNELDSQSIY